MIKNKSYDYWFVFVFFSFLIVKNIFYNYIFDIAKSPDIDYHVGVANVYKNNPKILFFWNPEKVKIKCRDPVKYNPRVATSPFLYHSIIGKIWFLTNSLRITALIQSIFGLMSIYFVYLLAKLISQNRMVSYLALVIAGTIPMFSYQINYINYDNLVNLAGIGSIYFLIKYWKEKEIKNLVVLFIFLFIGSLSKITFGPLLIIILIFLIFIINKNIFKVIKDFILFLFKKNNWLICLMFGFFLITTVLFYGRNIVKYKTIIPKYSYKLERSCP